MRKSLALVAILFLAYANALAADIEAGIKAALQKRRPDIVVDSVTTTPIAGLYEVFAGGQLYYTDAQAHYILDGNLFDLERNVSVRDERMKQLTSIRFDQLPLDLALKRVKGDGSRKLVYFGDPDCPYCKQLEQELTKVNNVTIYTFLFPLSIHPNADSTARKIWCAKDRAKAWTDHMLNNAMLTAIGDCATPIEKTKALAERLHVNETPVMFFADGQRMPGAIPADQIEQRFAEIQAKNK